MRHLFRYFSHDGAATWDYVDSIKHKCRIVPGPVYFNAALARIWFSTSPF